METEAVKSEDGPKCESCGDNEAKYRCPGCNRRTCSLPCVKKHKAIFSCSGMRCKTAYVAIKEYTDNTMLNDYRLLEDTGRVAYSALQDEQNKRKHLKKNVVNLLKKAKHSGVTLRLMPIGMKRRRENTSYFDFRKKHVVWRVQWLFPQSDADYSDKRLSEHEVIQDLLKKYIDPTEGDPVKRQRLKPYCQAGLDNICVFMKKEYQPANRERFYKLDITKTLRESLDNKTIIEYPCFHVVLRDKIHCYPTEEAKSKEEEKDEQSPEKNINIVVRDEIQSETTSGPAEEAKPMEEEKDEQSLEKNIGIVVRDELSSYPTPGPTEEANPMEEEKEEQSLDNNIDVVVRDELSSYPTPGPAEVAKPMEEEKEEQSLDNKIDIVVRDKLSSYPTPGPAEVAKPMEEEKEEQSPDNNIDVVVRDELSSYPTDETNFKEEKKEEQ